MKKNDTVNGKTTTGTKADGTYTFQVKDADGSVKATETITIKNGASNEVTVENLEPGTYTVSEDTSKNPKRMTLAGENDIEVEVEAGETAEVKTAEFTNDLETPAPSGKGEIKVKKELKGRAWKNGDRFTFGLSGSAGAPMPDKKSITITRDDAGHTKSFGKIKFTKAGKYVYYVKESRGSINGIKYDTKWHKVVIEVVDDGKGHLISKNSKPLIRTVKITNKYIPPRNPKTGGAGGLLAMIGLLISSIVGIVFLFIYRKVRAAGKK